MDIQNLYKSDVEELEKKVAELKKENPNIISRTYPMETPTITIEDIWVKLNEIETKLNMVFNEHILVNGVWRKP